MKTIWNPDDFKIEFETRINSLNYNKGKKMCNIDYCFSFDNLSNIVDE